MNTAGAQHPKKLIEVAIPLDVINEASAAEKLIKVGKPTNLHLWWARRPLAAARAIIFCQLVNDPSWKWELENSGKVAPNHVKASWAKQRKRLFSIITELVSWDNTSNEEVLNRARKEIAKSWAETCGISKSHPNASTLFNPNRMPGLHDPFAGGGVIPLEAQRLGLASFATDLNPVAVLINKALIDYPVRFSGQKPVSLTLQGAENIVMETAWPGVSGISSDIQFYGQRVLETVRKKIGNKHGKIAVTKQALENQPSLKQYFGHELTVIAWIWARTVKSPNPAFRNVDVPLVSSYVLSNKEGKEFYLEPEVTKNTYRFRVASGAIPDSAREGTKLARGANFKCIMSGAAIDGDYIKSEGHAGRIGYKMMAIIAEGKRGRVYLPCTSDDEAQAQIAPSDDFPAGEMVDDARAFTPVLYGIRKWKDLFTPRQQRLLLAFCDAIEQVTIEVKNDSISAGMAEGTSLEDGGNGAIAYSQAVQVFLTFAMTRMADWGNALCRWEPKAQVPQQLFGRQAIPMAWDFCEANFLSTSTGSYEASLSNIEASLRKSSAGKVLVGYCGQADAKTQTISAGNWVSTDPPYYDNIPYADLSDFFYIWMRRVLRKNSPGLFSTIEVPKKDELVATSYRHGGKQAAEAFFMHGMTEAMAQIRNISAPSAPVTIYYAFKQSETAENNDVLSTGWVSFLEAVFKSGLMITGTWPLRTENTSRMRGQGSNALASSIVLVCRPRGEDATVISRREFQRELNAILPIALDEMTKGSGDDASLVAPVDLSQAIIGPGMAVFSRHKAVLEADGTSMPVKTALQLINRFLAEDDFDHDTQFCLQWFSQYSWDAGKFGDADVLSRSKGTSVDGVKSAGVIESGHGSVRLLKWNEYPTDWNQKTDRHLPIWEALHHLIRALKKDGEFKAGELMAGMIEKAESIRQLAYRLYTLCERSGWSEDARAYNDLISSWSPIEIVAQSTRDVNSPKQTTIFDQN